MTFNEAKAKAVKDLAEDKETLMHCLERTMEKVGAWSPNKWWKSETILITVARILDRYGQFKDTSEVVDYFEKPYKFEQNMKFIINEM